MKCVVECVIAGLLALLLAPTLGEEPIIGGPCQGCEFVYVGLPDKLTNRGRIETADGKGEPLIVRGTVTTAQGAPAAGVIIYAYQTDAGGRYPKGMTWHGSLRTWVRTAADGGYQIDTIRPGSYPDRGAPEHIHMHVIESGKGTYYIDDIVFDDDPLLTKQHRRSMLRGRAGLGLTDPKRDKDGVWQVRRDIVLGKNISGYLD